MHNHNFDECKVIDIVILLLRSFPLHEGGHLLNIPAHEVREVHHSHPGKIHQQPDMIGIQVRKLALTAKIFDNELHQRSI